MRIITLTTDFGLGDWFVGTMKGVILSINPRAQIVDIAHDLPAGDVRAGAFALGASAGFFPKGTIHLAVVDPGVGGARQAIAIETENYFFIGPDNGLLSLAAGREPVRRIHRLENRRYFREAISRTFHGRDIFAPVAAHLSRGLPLSRLGAKLDDFSRITWPEPGRSLDVIEGEVIYVDRFGNALTNIDTEHLNDWPREVITLSAGNLRKTFPLGLYYQEVPLGKPLGLINSSGCLEIAVNGDSAAARLRLRVGSPVRVRRRELEM